MTRRKKRRMKIKGIEVEDFVNYKKPSMFIAVGSCDWKCCVEGGFDIEICHNSPLAHAEDYNVENDVLYNTFIDNPITEAIVIGGLEPLTEFDEVYNLIKYFRDKHCDAEFVIYTGYYDYEIKNEINRLKEFDNIIIKFGRFIKDLPSVYDEVLGVTLSSNNQYAINLKAIDK